MANLTRFNARRKPELLNSTVYSLINYREYVHFFQFNHTGPGTHNINRAETVLEEWKSLNETSTKIFNSLSADKQPAFFQLLHHPVQAGYILANMWISAGLNNLRASQARLSTNDLADQVADLFQQDYELEVEYHSILDGKFLSPLPPTRYNGSFQRQMGSYDGPNPRPVLLLATTPGKYVRRPQPLPSDTPTNTPSHPACLSSPASNPKNKPSQAQCASPPKASPAPGPATTKTNAAKATTAGTRPSPSTPSSPSATDSSTSLPEALRHSPGRRNPMRLG